MKSNGCRTDESLHERKGKTSKSREAGDSSGKEEQIDKYEAEWEEEHAVKPNQ